MIRTFNAYKLACYLQQLYAIFRLYSEEKFDDYLCICNARFIYSNFCIIYFASSYRSLAICFILQTVNNYIMSPLIQEGYCNDGILIASLSETRFPHNEICTETWIGSFFSLLYLYPLSWLIPLPEKLAWRWAMWLASKLAEGSSFARDNWKWRGQRKRWEISYCA